MKPLLNTVYVRTVAAFLVCAASVSGPALGRANIAYELSARTKATGHGGIGMIAKQS